MRRLACLLLIAPLLMVPACSDDDPTAPADAIRVTVNVRDTAGDPVAGLRLTMLSDNDFLQDEFPDKRGGKAAVTILWVQPLAVRVVLTIEDIEGGPVVTVVDELRDAGPHSVEWNGHDEADIRRPSGRYTVRLVVQDDQARVLHEQTRDMLLATLAVFVGVTDENGGITLTDRRLFPHLYDRPAMEAVNEAGEVLGSMVLTEEMIFRLADDPQTRTGTYRVQVTADGGALDLVWDPQDMVPVSAAGSVAVPVTQVVDVPPMDFELAPPFPNPFN